MGKMKLYDLAKELNLTSKELLKKAGELGIEAKSHLSSLEDSDVEKLRKSFGKKTQKPQEKPSDKKTTTKAQKDEKSTPVIIRREVIIEENNKKESVKKQEPKQNKNPFVQRNQNKDYNIVYRNKPEKPLTVSELFGLNKKKEEPKKEQEQATVKNQEVVEKVKEEKEVKEVLEEVVNPTQKEAKKEVADAARVKDNRTRKEPYSQNRDERNRNNNFRIMTETTARETILEIEIIAIEEMALDQMEIELVETEQA